MPITTTPKKLRPPVAISGNIEELQEFLQENRDRLADMEQLVAAPEKEEHLASLLRAVHTMKADASFVQLRDLRQVAHEAEGLLDFLHRGDLQLDGRIHHLLFDLIEVIRALLDTLEHALSVDGLLHPLASVDEMVERIRKSVAMGLMQGEKGGEAPLAERVARPTTVRIPWEQLERLSHVSERLNEELANREPGVSALLLELQGIITDLQMVPAQSLFQQLRRLARDTTHALGKQVDIVTEGDEVLLPRNIAGRLAEWLPHLVRNAVDHGLESPQTRIQVGKAPVGTILLRFGMEEGDLLVLFSDDGNGLLVEDDQLHRIFEPGFTTKETLSEVSGRGVGLDVVKRGVAELNGSIDVESKSGEGCSFTFRFCLRD